MIKGLDYFYDAQMRRFLEQIVRAFSGFQYQTGWRDDTPPQLVMVPCRMASTDRMVAHILRNGSENTLLTVPMITVAHTGLSGRREDLHNTQHVDVRQVVEREIDPATGHYTGKRGRSYTVERMMPRPFTMNVRVDVWTSNMEQKYQLAEQILTVMFPDFQIQNSDNPLDWSALTSIRIENVDWTSRSIPIGTENEIDIMSIELALPFWLSPPAKVKQQRIIEQIVMNVNDAATVEDGNLVERERMFQTITTPGNHAVAVDNGVITLLDDRNRMIDASGEAFSWSKLVEQYGTYRPTLSKIRLKTNPDIEDWTHDIVGTFQFDTTALNKIIFQIDPDTLPANTDAPVNAVIDPMRTYPGSGLPVAAEGQRYLVISDIGPSVAWGPLTARVNDVIEFRAGQWVVDLAAAQTGSTPRYLVNLMSGRQLRFNGTDWALVVDGTYSPGLWRLQL